MSKSFVNYNESVMLAGMLAVNTLLVIYVTLKILKKIRFFRLLSSGTDYCAESIKTVFNKLDRALVNESKESAELKARVLKYLKQKQEQKPLSLYDKLNARDPLDADEYVHEYLCSLINEGINVPEIPTKQKYDPLAQVDCDVNDKMIAAWMRAAPLGSSDLEVTVAPMNIILEPKPQPGAVKNDA